MSNSIPLNIPDTPDPPIFGYYNNKSLDTTKANSYDGIKNHLSASCKISNDAKGIFASDDSDKTKSIDMPYKKALAGKLAEDLAGVSGLSSTAQSQIQYLTCQLVNARNRQYDGSLFKVLGNNTTIAEVFKNNNASSSILVVIFIITMYLLLNGFFASFDVVGNIFEILNKNALFSMSYWIGLLLGLAFPIILLCTIYVQMICSNLNSQEVFDITVDPNGIKNTINENTYKIDYNILILFIIILYAFSAVLFTIKKSELGNVLYLAIVGTILIILSIFIYLLYVYIPFFSTGDASNVGNNTALPLKILIDNQIQLSDIRSNQHDTDSIKKTFGITFLVIFLMAIAFLIFGKKKGSSSGFIYDLLNGFLGSSAILVMPIIWVFNFVIGINYFYLFPIILIIFRFIRYAGMFMLWMITEKSDSMKDGFSDDLKKLLENFKDYSPSWGLIGVDLLKVIMNIIGYQNVFSDLLIKNENSGKNLSQNKFVSSGLLNMFMNFDSRSGMVYSIIITVLTILISVIILYGVVKIQS